MAFKREWVADWLDQVAPGERLLSYLVAAMWTPIVVKETFKGGAFSDGARAESLKVCGDATMDELIDTLAADPAMAVAPMTSAVFYALTDQRLLLGSRSGLRNRPKDLLHGATVRGSTVYWFDHDETAGNCFRHLLVDFGDGRWRRDRTGITALGKDLRQTSNVDAFFAELGEHGREVLNQP